MCLCFIDKEIDIRKCRRRGPYIVVWKIAREDKLITMTSITKRWYAQFQSYAFRAGWQRIATGCIRSPGISATYAAGYHAYVRYKDAVHSVSRGTGDVVLRCYVRPKDVVATGSQHGLPVVVAKNIWAPKCPKKRGEPPSNSLR